MKRGVYSERMLSELHIVMAWREESAEKPSRYKCIIEKRWLQTPRPYSAQWLFNFLFSSTAAAETWRRLLRYRIKCDVSMRDAAIVPHRVVIALWRHSVRSASRA